MIQLPEDLFTELMGRATKDDLKLFLDGEIDRTEVQRRVRRRIEIAMNTIALSQGADPSAKKLEGKVMKGSIDLTPIEPKPTGSSFDVDASNGTAHVPIQNTTPPQNNPSPTGGQYLHVIPNPICPIYIVNNDPSVDPPDDDLPHDDSEDSEAP